MRLVALAVLVGATLLTDGSAHARADQAIPASLALPDGHFMAFELAAQGVQVYLCQAKADDPAAFEWAFRFPEADLLNARGELVGTHYAGPTWEGVDGSSVVGAARMSADSPDSAAIPWLLLQAQANAGAGLFSTVTYVQRLDTSGGRAPATGCSGASAGAELRVPYTASYAYAYPVSAAP
jgi:hypothetical protein